MRTLRRGGLPDARGLALHRACGFKTGLLRLVDAGPPDDVNPSTIPRFRPTAIAMRQLIGQLRDRMDAAREGRRAKTFWNVTGRRASCRSASASISSSIAGSPFLELSPLAALRLIDNDAPAAGLVTGIGRVSGREVLIVANDATVKGGTYYPDHRQEARPGAADRARRIACRASTSSIRAARFLPLQAEVFPDRDHFGRIFFNQARMSARADSADCRGHGVVHGRRRLRAGDVRRDDHRQRARARSFLAALRW